MQLPEHIRGVFAKAKKLFSKEEIETALDKIAKEMCVTLADSNPIFLCVVIGGIVPLGNLLPRLDFPLEVDYVHVTRYRGTTRGGELNWRAIPTVDFTDRTVVVVDDILDGGLTLASVADYCLKHGANKVYTAVLVKKLKEREAGGIQEADFYGLEVDDHFIFGYGLDYEEYLRNAPGIYVVAPEHEVAG